MKGIPQGGPGSTYYLREYILDIPMTIFRNTEWERGDEEDRVEQKII